MGRTATRAKVLFNAGSFSVIGLNWLESVDACVALEESLEIWRALGSEYTLEATQSQLFLGYIQKRRLNKDSGIDYVLESIEAFKQLENFWWRALALNLYEILVWGSNDYQSCRNMVETEAALWNKAGDRHGIANVLFDMGTLSLEHGQFFESEGHLKESLEIFMEFKSKGYIQKVKRCLGDATRALKKFDLAQEYYEESAQLAQLIGWEQSVSVVYHGYGYVALHQGDEQRAEEYFYQSLRIDQEHNSMVNRAFCLMNFASVAAFREDLLTAARLFGAFYANIEWLQAESGSSQELIEPIDQLEIDHFLGLCQAQIDKADFDQAYNAGRLLSLDEALDEILKARGESLILEP